VRRRAGNAMTEYLLLAGLIALALLGGVSVFGGALEDAFRAAAARLGAIFGEEETDEDAADDAGGDAEEPAAGPGGPAGPGGSAGGGAGASVDGLPSQPGDEGAPEAGAEEGGDGAEEAEGDGEGEAEAPPGPATRDPSLPPPPIGPPLPLGEDPAPAPAEGLVRDFEELAEDPAYTEALTATDAALEVREVAGDEDVAAELDRIARAHGTGWRDVDRGANALENFATNTHTNAFRAPEPGRDEAERVLSAAADRLRERVGGDPDVELHWSDQHGDHRTLALVARDEDGRGYVVELTKRWERDPY